MEQIIETTQAPAPLTDEQLAALLAQPIAVTEDHKDEADEALVLN